MSTKEFFRLISSTVRLPKPKRKDLIDAEDVVSRTGMCTSINAFSGSK